MDKCFSFGGTTVTVRQPLVEAMLRYKEQQVYPLHTPGHKGGRGMAEPLKTELGAAALQLDVSLMAELDDIHQPEGCLKEAQDLAATIIWQRCLFFLCQWYYRSYSSHAHDSIESGR
jgi:arginine decarboxylase